jgi:hypothetical protein
MHIKVEELFGAVISNQSGTKLCKESQWDPESVKNKLYSSQSRETEENGMSPTAPETKNDCADVGQEQFA